MAVVDIVSVTSLSHCSGEGRLHACVKTDVRTCYVTYILCVHSVPLFALHVPHNNYLFKVSVWYWKYGIFVVLVPKSCTGDKTIGLIFLANLNF